VHFIPVFFIREANLTFSAPYFAAIRVLSGSTILSYIISQKPGFFATLIEYKMCEFDVILTVHRR